MRIIVCMKQVPDTAEIKIDPEKNTLIRTGVPSIVNPYDEYALEMAVRLRNEHGGSVTVLSMGPPQAQVALKTCLAAGADDAFLISDRKFGGSDTLATSYILSKTVDFLEEKQGEAFDLILCGKQAIDGDTGQVGPELAEHLGWVQLTYVVEANVAGSTLTAKREIEEGYEILETKLPAVLSVVKSDMELSFASIGARLKAAKTEIQTLSLEQIVLDEEKIGLSGSPTKVKKTFTPQVNKDSLIIRERTGVESAKKLASVMRDAGIVR